MYLLPSQVRCNVSASQVQRKCQRDRNVTFPVLQIRAVCGVTWQQLQRTVIFQSKKSHIGLVINMQSVINILHDEIETLCFPCLIYTFCTSIVFAFE